MRVRLAIVGLLLFAFGSASVNADAERDSQITVVLDEYMQALNALDLERHVGTYHFPHFRLASGKLSVWTTRSEAMPLLDVPVEQRREQLQRALGEGWDRSVWTRRETVQGDSKKVHVLTRFERLRADGSLISGHDSLYILTFEDGRWAIKGRSSFAP